MQYLLSILICLVLGFMTGVTWNRMEMQSTLERSKRQDEELSQHIAALTSQKSDLEQRLREFRQQSVNASQQDEYIALLEEDNSKLQDIRQALSEERRSLQKQLERAKQSITALEAERQDLLDGLSQANRKLKTTPDTENSNGAAEPIEFEPDPSNRYVLRVDCLDDLNALQNRNFAQVMRRILALQTDPVPAGGDRVLKYRYANVYRIRSGNYRICYLLKDDPLPQIQVVMVGNRDEGTYDDLERRLG